LKDKKLKWSCQGEEYGEDMNQEVIIAAMHPGSDEDMVKKRTDWDL